MERPVAIVLGAAPRADVTAAEIRDVLADEGRTVVVRSPDEVRGVIDDSSGPLALLVVVVDDSMNVDDVVLRSLQGLPGDDPRVILSTSREVHDDVDASVDLALLHAVVVKAAPGTMGWICASEMRMWREDNDFVLPGSIAGLEAKESEFLSTLLAPESRLIERLVEGVERALGPRTRLKLSAGIRMTRQGESVDGVYVLLKGRAALARATATETLLLHHASTGPVVGLLALTRRRDAYFTSTASEDVEAIHLSVDQVDRALRLQPQLGIVLAALTVRTLTARLLRSEELQIERNELNRELDAERSRLATTLDALKEARLELVSQARFAMLGELAAGVAHELNNPVAAISGVAGHLPNDLSAVLEQHPHSTLLNDVMRAASRRDGVATAVERAARREIEKQTGDPAFAFAIVGAGVTDVALAVRAANLAPQAAIAVASLGGGSRNIGVATARIRELVQSLRSHARPEGESSDVVDVHESLDDTLHLLSHRLRGIEIVRKYGEIPPIQAHPSQLGQVWTNLIVNAAEALGGEGRIRIATALEGDEVRVRITDNGPGIDPLVLPRIFEPRFTTKHGTVRYGLGLGMGISRRIVEEHGGTLTAESQPGRTVMTIVLPVTPVEAEE